MEAHRIARSALPWQDRQGEEIEVLRRMIEKNPDVIRFAMENQKLRGPSQKRLLRRDVIGLLLTRGDAMNLCALQRNWCKPPCRPQATPPCFGSCKSTWQP